MRLAVYARVSTDRQDVASQDYAIKTWLAARSGDEVIYYVDEGVSGKTLSRAQLQAMLASIERGEVDAVVTYRLDRISRKATEALTLLLDWANRGLDLYVVDQPVLNTTGDDPFRLTKLAMFSELAQVERETLVSRVKAGLAAAKARGVKLGKPSKLTAEQIATARELKAAGGTTREIGKALGVSHTTAYRALKREETA